MGRHATIPWTLVPILLMTLLAIPSLLPGTTAEIVTDLMIENELYYVPSSLLEGGDSTINVTLRTGLSSNMVTTIEGALDPSEGWTLELPSPIYLKPFDRVSFTVTVKAPPGIAAGSWAVLTLSAKKEDGGLLGSDQCTIEVMPTRKVKALPASDAIIDGPLEGEFRLIVQNVGNVRSTWSVDEAFGKIGPTQAFTLEPGDLTELALPYDMSALEGSENLLLRVSPGAETLPVRMVRELDRLHIVFSWEPVLVLFPSGPANPGSVDLLVLGGEVSNIGIEPSDGPEGGRIEAEELRTARELDRHTFHLKGKGFSGTEPLMVRAFGFFNGERIMSNEVPVNVKGEEPARAFPATAVAVGGGAAGGVSALAVTAAYLYTASETFRWRWLLLTFIPLYSLIKEDHVLDHFFRGRLYEYVKGNPGVTYTALKEHFDVNNGTLTYHLLKLEREGLLVHRNMGRYKMFYAEGIRIRGCEIVVSALDIEMMTFIGNHPGITVRELFASVPSGMSKRTLSRHLKQLQRKGFVEVRSVEGARRLFLREGEHRYLVPRKGVMEMPDLQGQAV